MPDYTQANRPIRVDTVLDEDVLLLNGFNGLEGMSQAYAFQLDLLSTTPDIDPAELLRTPVRVSLRLDDGETRLFHGICTRFSQGLRRGDLTTYRAEIVPWLWFLRLSRESRIYQELTVPEILEQVFQRLGYTDFELRLTRSYPARVYCVQYRETHFDFVSRLMEEEGIFYYFEHAADRHVLVLTDDSSLSVAAPGAETARYTLEDTHVDEVIWELDREHSVHTGKVTLSDYDFEQPALDLLRGQGDDDHEELYDYPGRYTQPDDGERLALIWLEAEEMQRQVVQGEGNRRGFIPGFNFTLQEHYRRDANGKYLITSVQHLATSGQYRAWDANAGVDYQNTFTCIPDGTPYRAPRRTARPLIHGSQSALVVGPGGEEIHTDRYGRVKVQFYWDRDGRRDENSSCWIRVTTPWGGKGYGSVSIPRIGNEVIVAFEEGDPDRPIIIGSVYNADQTPPFDLPGAGITMGMNSRSSPKGGGNNQIAMTDTKGKELINIHAQYDMTTTVEHDDTQTVKNDRTITVTGNKAETISKGDSTFKVGTGKHTETIKGDTLITVESGTFKLDVQTKTHTHEVKGDVIETYKANQETTVTNTITISAGDSLTLKSGDSRITLKKDGTITIAGKNVVITGSDSVKVSGKDVQMTGDNEAKLGVGSQQVTCSTAKVNTSGAAINSSAVGMHEITGALVKIN
jgi:type VI secretion system secreted protein VgrG